MSERVPQRIPYGLIVSVLINMALIGLIAGLFMRHGPPGPAAARDRPWAAMQPSRDDERAIRRVIVRGLREAQDDLASRRATEQAFVAALTAEPYDPSAVDRALTAFRAADCRARDTAARAIVAELGPLTPEQRAMSAKLISAGLDGRAGRRGGRLGREHLPDTPPE